MVNRQIFSIIASLIALAAGYFWTYKPGSNCDRSVASIKSKDCADHLTAQRAKYGESSYDYITTRVNGSEIEFIQTNRSLDDLRGNGMTPIQFTFPARLMNISEMVGKTVLDVPSGGGQLVMDLRAHNVEAYGVDVSLPDSLKDNPFFKQGSIYELPYKSLSVDIAYCNFFFMGLDGHPELMRKSLEELKRVIKPSGKIRILRFHDKQQLADIALSIGLKITDQPRESEVQKEFFEFQVGSANRFQ